MSLIILCFLSGIVLLGIGIYQIKTYFGQPHEQNVKVTGYIPYQSRTSGIQRIAMDALSSVTGMRHPVVDITLNDGSLKTVRLDVTVNDKLIETYPEFGVHGDVSVLFFGNDPQIAYLTNHKMAQTVMRTSAPLLAGIAVLVMAVILTIVYIVTPASYL